MTSNLSPLYWTNFDSLWSTLTTGTPFWNAIQDTPKKNVASLPSYPHCNCWVSEDLNTLNLEFALAGFLKKGVSVMATGSQLRIQAKLEAKKDRYMIHQGMSEKDIDFTLSIDEVYDVTGATTEFKDGVLSISMSRLESNEVTKLL